jgi:hypothetical protein
MVGSTERKTNMKKLMMIIGTALAIAGSAHARIGWSYQDCVNAWGQPEKFNNSDIFGSQSYWFRSSTPGLFVEVFMLNETVHHVTYVTKNKQFLINNSNELLQRNLSGFWSLYDDGRGKKTLHTWQYTNADGQLIAYALLMNQPVSGWYQLMISTGYWNSLCNQNGGNQPVGLNI